MPTVNVPLDEYNAMKQTIAVLQQQVDWLSKQVFGTGKSEKLDKAQLQLSIDAPEQAPIMQPQQISYERDKPSKRSAVDADKFAHLPVDEEVVIEPDEVKRDPELYERISQEETFEVDIVPPRLFKRKITRPKYRHKLDKSRPPVCAPAAKRVCEGGYASAGLLAWVTLSKYVDHLPLYRQEKMFKRWRADISRQTMSSWIELVADWLKPIYNHMCQGLLESGFVQADETPVRFNDPDHKKGKSSQGWLWAFSRPEGDVVYHWRTSRRHDELLSLFSGYKGVLQSDAYEACHALARSNADVELVGCWAHARRKFYEAQQESPLWVGMVLRLIARLYQTEKQLKTKGLRKAQARSAYRHAQDKLTLGLLHGIVCRMRERCLPQTRCGKAAQYMLNQWSHLVNYLEHGEVPIDNDAMENAIRPTAVGKKNWLFIGHPEAGERSAIIYSIVVSCQRRGIEPFAYIKDVLTRLPTMTNQDDISAITPTNWSPQ